jgi:hypothetical protein
MHDLVEAHRGWIEESLKEGSHFRDEKWRESVAVGSETSVTATKEKLGVKAKGREVIERNGSCELRESPAPDKGILGHENGALRLENTYFGEENLLLSTE